MPKTHNMAEIHIVRIADNAVVKVLDVRKTTDRELDLCLRGVMFKVDLDSFFVRELTHNDVSDWICLRCGCQCAPDGSKHTAGGPGMKSCGKDPVPVRRTEFEAEAEGIAAAVRARRPSK